MTGSSQQSSVFRNTVIFSVVAALIMVVLLVVVIAVPGASRFRVGFLTVDIGLLVIIIVAISRINSHNSQMAQLMQNAANTKMTVDTCPSYFTTKRVEGNVMCAPSYLAPRSNVMYTFLDGSNNPLGEFRLSTFDGHTAKDVCTNVNSTSYDGVDQTRVPWTDLRAKCNTLQYNL